MSKRVLPNGAGQWWVNTDGRPRVVRVYALDDRLWAETGNPVTWSGYDWLSRALTPEETAALVAERDALRAEVAVLRATGRVTADDLITICMGDCGAITEEDSDGCCAGCGNDTALVVGIGSSEAVLEAFEARERRHGPREVAP